MVTDMSGFARDNISAASYATSNFISKRRHVAFCGADALVYLARAMQGAVRKRDVASRWGGEEFVILKIGATMAEGRLIAQRFAGRLKRGIFYGPKSSSYRNG